MRPSQSPTNGAVAWVSTRAGRTQLWLAEADGSNPRPLPASLGLEPDEPAWSPDGTRLAFTAREGGRLAVCVLELAGGARQLGARTRFVSEFFRDPGTRPEREEKKIGGPDMSPEDFGLPKQVNLDHPPHGMREE